MEIEGSILIISCFSSRGIFTHNDEAVGIVWMDRVPVLRSLGVASK